MSSTPAPSVPTGKPVQAGPSDPTLGTVEEMDLTATIPANVPPKRKNRRNKHSKKTKKPVELKPQPAPIAIVAPPVTSTATRFDTPTIDPNLLALDSELQIEMMTVLISMKQPLFIMAPDKLPILSDAAVQLIADSKHDNSPLEGSSPLRHAFLRAITRSIQVPEMKYQPNNLHPAFDGHLISTLCSGLDLGEFRMQRTHSSKDFEKWNGDVGGTALALLFRPVYRTTMERTYLHSKDCSICDWASSHVPTAPPRGITWSDIYGFIQFTHLSRDNATVLIPMIRKLINVWKETIMKKPLSHFLANLENK